MNMPMHLKVFNIEQYSHRLGKPVWLSSVLARALLIPIYGNSVVYLKCVCLAFLLPSFHCELGDVVGRRRYTLGDNRYA